MAGLGFIMMAGPQSIAPKRKINHQDTGLQGIRLSFDEEDVLTADGFMQRVANKRAVAEAMVESRGHCREAWLAAGFAAEFALKAMIMRQEGFNAWPSAAHRPDLHVHTLRSLCEKAGIDLKALKGATRVAFRVALDWNRAHDYSVKPMSRQSARAMVEAIFGPEGVIQWIAMSDEK